MGSAWKSIILAFGKTLELENGRIITLSTKMVDKTL
jgi:hypothetical protein